MRETKRARLSRATKRTKRAHPAMTWQQARQAALAWCTTMWPDDFYCEVTPIGGAR